ncbi:MAG: DUF456 domain-containing protein [Deltaproteobacteria bacterium]|nr:DUF456 domain-containing protein [Deltaproteobacteria bacterium]
MLETALAILGLFLAIAGLAACVVPVLPGPAISYLSLLVLSLARDWQPFGPTFLLVTAGIMIAVSLLDGVIVLAGAKRWGASRAGMAGAVVGLVLGMIFLPFWGVFAGAFAGAVAGELIGGVTPKKALAAGWGVLAGNLGAIALKLSFCSFVLVAYVVKLF